MRMLSLVSITRFQQQIATLMVYWLFTVIQIMETVLQNLKPMRPKLEAISREHKTGILTASACLREPMTSILAIIEVTPVLHMTI